MPTLLLMVLWIWWFIVFELKGRGGEAIKNHYCFSAPSILAQNKISLGFLPILRTRRLCWNQRVRKSQGYDTCTPVFIIYSITYRFCVQKAFKSACGLPHSRDVFVERKTRRFAKSNLFLYVIVIAFIRRCENKPFERAYPWREHVTKAKLCSRRVSFWFFGTCL